MSKTLDIEEYLGDNNVFLSGINGRPAHSDSYMTILDFSALQKAVGKGNLFTRQEWTEAAEYWIEVGYLTPTLKILGLTTKRWLSEDSFFQFI